MKEVQYPLGYSAHEEQRLARQGAQLEESTEDVLRRAGLRPGMKVLDIGCGVGDVSLLVAKIVGREGAVLGVDKAASSIESARRRAESLGEANLRFERADLGEFTTDRTFDALLGRFVLSYVPDRVGVLQRLTRYLNPGAVVALQEIDLSQMAQVPPSDLFLKARQWVLQAFSAAGAEVDMGTQLYATFLGAGLPAPHMTAVTPVVGGSDSPGYEQLVQALRSLLPIIERSGIAAAGDIDIDTITQRLRDDARANRRVIFMSRVVGAWSRLA